MLAILTLLFVVVLSMLVTKVASIALEHTGMERERARFQARSAFTGAGFTTSESEMVVKHPVRRKIIMTLLLLGNAGVVTAISSLIIGFTSQTEQSNHQLFLMLLAGILFLYLLSRSRKLERLLDRILTVAITRYSGLRPRSFARLMTVMHDYEVMEVSAEDNAWMCGSTLAELNLTAEGILVLGVMKSETDYDGVPRGGYRIQPEDKLVMYGRRNQIENVSARCDELQGREEHLKSKEEFATAQQEEESSESE